MGKIGGNLTAILQVKDGGTKNAIGELVHGWEDAVTLTGWLDLSSGDSKYTNYSAKIQESTHVFLCGYQDLSGITVENSRLVVSGRIYEVLLIDNPMELCEQLEIYLRFIGGQDGD